MIGQHIWLIPSGAGTTGALDYDVSLTSTADTYSWVIPERCVVVRAGLYVATIFSSSVSAVLEFDRIPYAGGSREATFAQITIPTGATVGDYYYQEPTSTKTLYPGDTVVVQVATAATSTGTGVPFLIVEPIPERPTNESWAHSA
jgi:hypothetical protein